MQTLINQHINLQWFKNTTFNLWILISTYLKVVILWISINHFFFDKFLIYDRLFIIYYLYINWFFLNVKDFWLGNIIKRIENLLKVIYINLIHLIILMSEKRAKQHLIISSIISIRIERISTWVGALLDLLIVEFWNF